MKRKTWKKGIARLLVVSMLLMDVLPAAAQTAVTPEQTQPVVQTEAAITDEAVTDADATISGGDTTATGRDATVSDSDVAATVTGGDATVSNDDGTVSDGDGTVSDGDITVSDGDATVSADDISYDGEGETGAVNVLFNSDIDKPMIYDSFEEAVDSLATDFGEAGCYDFYLTQDVVMTKDIVLPDFVQTLRLNEYYDFQDVNGDSVSESILLSHKLDLQGHTLTATNLNISTGVQICSTAEKGKLVITGDMSHTGLYIQGRMKDSFYYQNASGEWVSFGDGTGYETTVFDNLEISVANSTVAFFGGDDAINATYRMNADLTAATVHIDGSNWIVNTLNCEAVPETTGSMIAMFDNSNLEVTDLIMSDTCERQYFYRYTFFGRIKVTGTMTMCGYGIDLAQDETSGDIGTLDVNNLVGENSSKIRVEKGAIVRAGTVNMPDGELENRGGTVEIDTVENIRNLINLNGSVIVDTIKSVVSGCTSNGILYVNKKATIDGAMVETGNLYIYLAPDAELAINEYLAFPAGYATEDIKIARVDMAEGEKFTTIGAAVAKQLGNNEPVLLATNEDDTLDSSLLRNFAEGEVVFRTDIDEAELPTDRIILLNEDVDAEYTYLRLDGTEAKATTAPTINLFQILTSDEDGSTYDYLLGTFFTVKEAFNEINRKNNKYADYLVKVNEDTGEDKADLELPTAAKSLHIQGSAGKLFTLDFKNLTQSCDLTLENIQLVVEDDKGGYGLKNPIVWKTSGHKLTIRGNVYILDPVSLDGGKDGVFTLEKNAQFMTITNAYKPQLSNKSLSYVVGSVKNFAEVNILSYITLYIKQNEYEDALTGEHQVLSEADFQTKVLNIEYWLSVEGKCNIGDINASGKDAKVDSGKDFNITGKLINNTTTSLTLRSTRKTNSYTPYLNISGKIETQIPIMVGVLDENMVSIPFQLTTVGVRGHRQLLTAKYGKEEDFRPEPGCGSSTPYDQETTPYGYVMVKKGTSFEVLFGTDFEAILYADETPDEKQYFWKFEDAVKEINRIGNKDTAFTIQVNIPRSVGAEDAPMVWKFPDKNKAAKLTIDGNYRPFYYTNDLVINTDTVLKNVVLRPMKKSEKGYVGAKHGITAKNVSLIMDTVGIEDFGIEDALPGMGISKLSGKEITLMRSLTIDTIDVSILILNRGTGFGEYDVNGTCKIGTLRFDTGADLNLNGMATITDIDTMKAGTSGASIRHGRTKDKSNLTISGEVKGNLNLIMSLPEGKTIADYQTNWDTLADKKTGLEYHKIILSDTKKLVTAPKLMKEYSSDSSKWKVTFYLKDELGRTDISNNVLKTEKGFFYVTEEVMEERTELAVFNEKDIKIETVYCLDFAQAVKEIEKRKNPNYSYQVSVRGEDTVLTDAAKYSPLIFPKANMARTLTVICLEGKIPGDVTVYGDVTLNSCDIVSVKGAFDDTPKPCAINLKASGKTSKLFIRNSFIGAMYDEEAPLTRTISKITGVKGVSSLQYDPSFSETVNVNVIGAISGLKELSLRGYWSDYRKCCFTTENKVEADSVKLIESIVWTMKGQTNIGNLDISEWIHYSLEIPQDTKGNPMLNIKGNILRGSKTYNLYVKVIPSKGAAEYTAEDYLNGVKLAKVGGTTGDVLVAEPFKNIFPYIPSKPKELAGVTAQDLIVYKDMNGYVMNGDKRKMSVELENSDLGAFTYAKSYAEAIKILNMANDANGNYVLRLLKNDVLTGTGEKPAAFTIPTKAASVVISSAPIEGGTTTIRYTGALKPSCRVEFENVILKEMSKDNATETITADLSNAKGALIFSGTTASYKAEGSALTDKLVFAKVSGGKGDLTLESGNVHVKGDLLADELIIGEPVDKVVVGGKCTVKTLGADTDIDLSADGLMTIGDIVCIESEDGHHYAYVVTLRPAYTKKAWGAATSQLTINGLVDGWLNFVDIRPRVFDGKEYQEMTPKQLESLKVAKGETPNANQKLFNLKKEGNDWFEIIGYAAIDQDHYTATMKYNGGVYLTDLDNIQVYVNREFEDRAAYDACFADWNSAVKEIESLNDKTAEYVIALGDTVTCKSLSMPSKAAEVTVMSTDGTMRAIVFEGNKVTLKCNMVLDGVYFSAMKKVNGNYEKVPCDIAIGNFALTERHLKACAYIGSEARNDYIYFRPGAITGSAKGVLNLDLDESPTGEEFFNVANKISNVGTVNVNMITDGTYCLNLWGPVSGVTNLNVGDNATLQTLDGGVSAKNVSVGNGATLQATSINITNKACLSGGTLRARDNYCKTGFMKLNNVVLAEPTAEAKNVLDAQLNQKNMNQLTIAGTVTAAEGHELHGEDLEVVIYKVTVIDENSSNYEYAQLSDGFVLLNAKKADAATFVPHYTDESGLGMGEAKPGYGLVKNPKTGDITYKKL